MKRIAAVIAALSFASLGARAADEKSEMKKDGHVNADGTGKVTTTKKVKRGRVTRTEKSEHALRKNVKGGTTETRETTVAKDRPGIGNDSRATEKETIERDAQGNVVRHEKKADGK